MKRTTGHTRTAIALLLVFGAIAAPAQAMPRPDQSTGHGPASGAQAATGKPQSSQPAPATTVRVARVEASHAFSWGDAAIGGAAMLALAVIALGATMAMGGPNARRRPAGSGRGPSTRTSS